MKLAIFDVDRTLVFTRWRDGHGFVQALTDVTGITGVSWDWHSYRYSSDDGIVHEIFERERGRQATPDELAALRTRFVEVLHEHRADDSEFVVEVPGAAALIAQMRASDDWTVALATGGWRVAAHAKLVLAGIDVADAPGGYADDAFGRTEIIGHGRRRAEAAHGPFDRVVFVGDARWDVKAARRLGLPFVGVGDEPERVDALRRAGAQAIIGDYRDANAARAAFDAAVPPLDGDDGHRPPDAD